MDAMNGVGPLGSQDHANLPEKENVTKQPSKKIGNKGKEFFKEKNEQNPPPKSLSGSKVSVSRGKIPVKKSYDVPEKSYKEYKEGTIYGKGKQVFQEYKEDDVYGVGQQDYQGVDEGSKHVKDRQDAARIKQDRMTRKEKLRGEMKEHYSDDKKTT